MKEDMSLSNLGTVALHAAKVPTNVFSSTLICILTLDYVVSIKYRYSDILLKKNLNFIYSKLWNVVTVCFAVTYLVIVLAWFL